MRRAPPRWVVLRTFAGFHSPYFGLSSTMPDDFLRPRHPNPTHHVGGTKWPDEVAPTTRMAGRGHASTHFLLPTGSCVDMPRHGSAQSWVIRMPGFQVSLEDKRVSGYPRRAEESPFLQLPAGPAGDNRAPSNHLACCHSRIPSSPPFPHFRFFHCLFFTMPDIPLRHMVFPDCLF